MFRRLRTLQFVGGLHKTTLSSLFMARKHYNVRQWRIRERRRVEGGGGGDAGPNLQLGLSKQRPETSHCSHLSESM